LKTTETSTDPVPATGAPQGYELVREYFGTPALRRQVLGVVANTIASWDRGTATRVAKRHADAVRDVAWTMRELEGVFGSGRLAAQWLLQPQAALDGIVPAAAVRKYGRDAARSFVQIARETRDVARRRALADVLADSDLWDAVGRDLSDAARARRSATAAAVGRYRKRAGALESFD
jgi:hypothetical protein